MQINKPSLCRCIYAAILKQFSDPTVEIQTTLMPNQIRLRVTQDNGLPMYYRITIVKET